MKDRGSCFLSGNQEFREIEVTEQHFNHMIHIASLFRGWKYREMKAFKRKAYSECSCKICLQSAFTTLAYLKVHVSIYKNTTICSYIFKNFLTLPGQEEYAKSIEDLALVFDRQDEGLDDEAEEIRNKHEFLLLRPRSMELPALNCFPRWKVVKESKKYLTLLDPPTLDQQKRFREKAKVFISNLKLKRIPIPAEEAEVKLGASKYYDAGLIKQDSERPERSYHGVFKLQNFMTGPLTPREVWLPSKAYKYNSIWWHIFAGSLINRIPSVVSSDSPLEIIEDFWKVYEPSRTIDLKGCGLQYPREYILILMNVINEMFPSEEGREHEDIAKGLFANIMIEEDNGKCYHPLRGVGLGYYQNLMVLASAIMLSDCKVIKMFSDDILIRKGDYSKGIEALESFGMIINQKKSGITWYKSPMFAGIQICTLDKTISTFELENAELSAIFTKRYHWERKSLCNSLNEDTIIYFAFHYEKIFGYEFFKGESLMNPSNLGINTLALPIKGYRSDYFLSKNLTPKADHTENPYIYPMNVIFTSKERKEHHFKRKRMFRHKEYTDTSREEYIRPLIEKRSMKGSRIKLNSIARSTPTWSEFNQMVYRHIEVGRYSLYIDKKDIQKALVSNGFADNPIASYQQGGYDITTPYYYASPPDDEKQQLAELIQVCEIQNQPWAYAVEDKLQLQLEDEDWCDVAGHIVSATDPLLELRGGDDENDNDNVSIVIDEDDPYGNFQYLENSSNEEEPEVYLEIDEEDVYGAFDLQLECSDEE
jgi:hypothetical protein